MKRSIAILIISLIPAFSFSQTRDSITYVLRGQVQDQSVRAYFAFNHSTKKGKNILVFKKGPGYDTLDVSNSGSVLPTFKDTVRMRSVQLDNQGLDEIVLSWDVDVSEKKIRLKYTLYIVWDLDTRKRVFYMTPDYDRISKDYLYTLDPVTDKIRDTISTDPDTCMYHCDFRIDPSGEIVVSKAKQTGSCHDNNCWKRMEGIYLYREKELIRKD